MIAAGARQKDDPHYLVSAATFWYDIMSNMRFWRYADKRERLDKLHEIQQVITTQYEPGESGVTSEVRPFIGDKIIGTLQSLSTMGEWANEIFPLPQPLEARGVYILADSTIKVWTSKNKKQERFEEYLLGG